MKPKRRRERLESATAARARMFLKADLGWLGGYPLSVSGKRVLWVSLPKHGEDPSGPAVLGREELRRATYTWSKLSRRFPRALPGLVGDAQEWTRRVGELLTFLKGPVHRGTPLRASLLEAPGAYPKTVVRKAKDLLRHRPGLAPLVSALTWSHYTDPASLSKAADWIRELGKELERTASRLGKNEAVRLLSELWELFRREGSRPCFPLLGHLLHPLAFVCPTEYRKETFDAMRAAVRKHRKGREAVGTFSPPMPPPVYGREWTCFLTRLLRTDPSERRRALRLVKLLPGPRLLRSWDRWRQAIGLFVRKINQMLSKGTSEERARAAADLDGSLGRLETTRPAAVHIGVLLDHVLEASAAGRERFHSALERFLATVPSRDGNLLLVPAWLHHAIALRRIEEKKAARFLHVLRSPAIAPLHEALRKIWKKDLEAWNKEEPRFPWSFPEIVDELPAGPLWTRALEALRRVAKESSEPLDGDDEFQVAELFRITRDVDETVRAFQGLAAAGVSRRHVSTGTLRFGLEISEDSVDFGKIVRTLDENEELTWERRESLDRIHGSLKDAGHGGMVRELVLERETGILLILGEELRLLDALGEKAPMPPRGDDVPILPKWGAHYPDVFHPWIRRLEAVTPEAEKIVRRRLGRAFPGREDLRRELEAIRSKPAHTRDTRLRTRAGNLARRLQTPARVSPGKVRKLVETLRRAVRQAVLDTWKGRLEKAFSRSLRAVLSVESLPPWVLESRHTRAIAELVGLPREFREPALRLLKLRSGDPPWNLSDHPKNRAFLERLRRNGIRTDPWVHPAGPWTAETPEGSALQLRFEDDPLEIFQMGAPFGTCLAPGGEYFYSVVTNAVDVNKRVLFARGPNGTVVGRCLFALTDEGAILTFHPYCHDGKLGFGAHVARIAKDLAREMNSLVLQRGHVSALAAPGWHDDGPVDLCGRYPALRDGSPFRKALPTLAPGELVLEIGKAFSPLPVGPLVLGLVISLPEMQRRPELIRPLRPVLEAETSLTYDLARTAAELFLEAGDVDAARRMLERQVIPRLLRHRLPCGCPAWPDSLDLLVRVLPGRALRVLRETRHRGVRSDEDETDTFRIRHLADAHEALGRKQRAERLRKKL